MRISLMRSLMRISLVRISYRVCCSVTSTPAARRPRAVSSTWLVTGDVAPAMHNRSVVE